MNIDDQNKIYGCTLKELQTSVEQSMTSKKIGPVEIAMNYATIMKDMVNNNQKTEAIQFANRLKWILSTYVMDDE